MSQVKESAYRRRNYYIDRSFQSKFIIKFCGLVALGSVVTMFLLYWLARQTTTVSIVQSRVQVMTTADFLVPLMIQTVMIVTLIVGVAAAAVTLVVSHKIAGPLFRFRETFKELSGGNFSNQVRLRKGDQLVEVANEFNHMIASIRGQVIAARTTVEAARSDLETIGEFSIEDNKRHKFLELRKKLQDLEKVVNFFRT